MPSLHACPLSRLPETVAATGASHLVTLATMGSRVERPDSIDPGRHLTLGVSDISAPMADHVLPAEAHVCALLDFVRSWDRERPLVIHCYAGISRSTAAIYSAVCALRPDRDEADVAQELRRLSPSATPNRLIVEIADGLLGRDGRMIAAIADIGRGAEAYEGVPFGVSLA
ncbi:protein tyrosine phosphatase [Methylobacterium sp. C25]|uniref:tyrosine phosphatase family protein n=1 Tax=Methylobacterium sp. C25 TaxID=2721622 RepID=UPI001F2DF7C5|nr:tyrosine phosphatase family protein [Methylobacterium sp. C25]MCE4225799.1 protein tyrosine phosphatase [Methylobacterium sp. C25]